jgi:CubicO group peptidase (beta-lactamase class C family)
VRPAWVVLLAIIFAATVAAYVRADEKSIYTQPPSAKSPLDVMLDIPDIEFDCRLSPRQSCRISEFIGGSRVCALLVIHRGIIRFEAYNTVADRCDSTEGADGPEKEYGIASVTKSVIDLALGDAIARSRNISTRAQFERVLREPIGALIPDLASPGTKGGYADVPLARVVSMRSGIDWRESLLRNDASRYSKLVKTKRQESIVEFARGFGKAARADAYLYKPLDPSIAVVVAETLLRGERLNAFIERGIWRQIGAEHGIRWKADSKESPLGDCCAYMTARDLARIGQFVVARGRNAKGDVVIPSAWFDIATRSADWNEDRIPEDSVDHIAGCPMGYRHFWWLREGADDFSAIGIGGHFLHVYPNDETVIVQISDWSKWSDSRACESLRAHDALRDAVSGETQDRGNSSPISR